MLRQCHDTCSCQMFIDLNYDNFILLFFNKTNNENSVYKPGVISMSSMTLQFLYSSFTGVSFKSESTSSK